MGSGNFSDELEKENFQTQIHIDLSTHRDMRSQNDDNTGQKNNVNFGKQKSPHDKESVTRSHTTSNIFNEEELHEGFKKMGEINNSSRLAPDSNFDMEDSQLKNWESFWCNTEGYKTKHIQPFHFTSGLEEIKEPVMEVNISTSPYKGQRPNSAPTECSAATTTFTKTQLEVSFLKTNLLTYIKKEIDICLTSIPFFDDAIQMQKKFLEYRDIELDEEYELKILGELLNELNFFHLQENCLLNRELAVRKFSNQSETQNLPSLKSFRASLIPMINSHSPSRMSKRNGKSFEESYEFTTNSSNFWEKAEFQNSASGTPNCFPGNNLYQTKPFMPFENQNEPSFNRMNVDCKQHFNSGRSIQKGLEARSYRGLNGNYQNGYATMTKSFGNIDLNKMPKKTNEETYGWS
ncbi:hypothetical protein SEUBUCD646_0G01080 [Saccharomyces eubayanus]|nr:hypothetical protein SEUBUCD646_0G01080 [Saccharomyces eubayanus]